jgi:uncharacterized protein (DUF1697 family)
VAGAADRGDLGGRQVLRVPDEPREVGDRGAAIEEVMAVDGAILWATRRDALNRSVMRKLIGGAAYKELTVRSLNTTLELHRLLAA